MKTLTLLIMLLSSCVMSEAQNYIVLANDPSGDPDNILSPDLSQFSYRLTADSIIFKIDFHERLDNTDWNLAIGLDTNLNPNDGAVWPGGNSTMNYDLIMRLFFNTGFPPISGYVNNSAQQYVSSAITMFFGDTATIIAGLRLSDFMLQLPLQFVAGTGIVLGDINDEIPDNGFVTTLINDILVASGRSGSTMKIFPNPATDYLRIETDDNTDQILKNYIIFDLNGRCIHSGTMHQNKIPLNELGSGSYFLQIPDISGSALHKFRKN